MSKPIKIDLTGVESFQRVSAGIHPCKIASAELKQSQGGNDMIVIAFEVTKGDDKGGRVYENFPLVDKALWKLKGLLQAIGMKADGKVAIDLDKLVGKTLTAVVREEEYEGTVRAKIDELRKLSVASSNDDDEDDDLDEDDDDIEDDEEEEEEAPKKPAKKAPAKKATKKEPEPEEDEDDDEDWDDEDEDDEEEEPAPKKAAKKAAKPAKKPAKKAEPEDDDDEDDDDDWDEE